ncbi:uncharacterized protein LOC132265508 [Phlebotomus argentipes]|uniref:uncharacterized protein LOC132265508 n=1 Tax=Phlebotomus argentipes TaxID=94469 RepID=UPI00289364AB|nr:uncharacterized protein LOC132265508 [Phlebotomus argentipes]
MNIDDAVSRQVDLLSMLKEIRDRFTKEGPTRRAKKGISYHQDQFDKLLTIWKEFDQNDSQLRQSADENHEYFTSFTYDLGKDSYKKMKSLIEKAMTTDFQAKPNPEPKPLDIPAGDSHNENNDGNPIPPNDNGQRLRQMLDALSSTDQITDQEDWIRPNSLPKLPPVKLHKFSGKNEEWQAFIELFMSVIHGNPYISKVQKLHYLITHLDGQPKQLLAHFSLTDANYDSALQILNARYNNQRQMVTNYMNAIVYHKKLNVGSADDVIHLHDAINSSLAGLKNLGYDISTWDPILVTVAIQKFDPDSNKAFEENISDITAVPTIPELLKFLMKRYRVLLTSPKDGHQSKDKKKSFHITSAKDNCSKCGRNHPLIKCFEFKKLSPYDRTQFAKDQNLCLNCLYHDKKDQCKSKKTCFTCNKKHHTLLHFENKKFAAQSQATKAQAEDASETVAMYSKSASVILPTAQLKIQARDGGWHLMRALLDTGSGETFISESAAQILRLPKRKLMINIKGIGEVNAGTCKAAIDIIISPRMASDQKWNTTALVLPKLSSFLPANPISSSFDLHRIEKLTLADPKFNVPGHIDLILGTEIYSQIIRTDLKRDPSGLVAQETGLGWIILGNTLNPGQHREVISMISLADLDKSLRAYWEMDTGDGATIEEHTECEEHFECTHLRGSDGQYQVRLPFKNIENAQLGESRNQALARFLSMEKKFAANN